MERPRSSSQPPVWVLPFRLIQCVRIRSVWGALPTSAPTLWRKPDPTVASQPALCLNVNKAYCNSLVNAGLEHLYKIIPLIVSDCTTLSILILLVFLFCIYLMLDSVQNISNFGRFSFSSVVKATQVAHSCSFIKWRTKKLPWFYRLSCFLWHKRRPCLVLWPFGYIILHCSMYICKVASVIYIAKQNRNKCCCERKICLHIV